MSEKEGRARPDWKANEQSTDRRLRALGDRCLLLPDRLSHFTISSSCDGRLVFTSDECRMQLKRTAEKLIDICRVIARLQTHRCLREMKQTSFAVRDSRNLASEEALLLVREFGGVGGFYF